MKDHNNRPIIVTKRLDTKDFPIVSLETSHNTALHAL